MLYSAALCAARRVALLTESVDRNTAACQETVDWRESLSSRRAWIEIKKPRIAILAVWSLSSRRAWIEILFRQNGSSNQPVALLTESVDRNTLATAFSAVCMASLSSRRAWIEIKSEYPDKERTKPSLSSRRAWIEIPSAAKCGTGAPSRSPHGERG